MQKYKKQYSGYLYELAIKMPKNRPNFFGQKSSTKHVMIKWTKNLIEEKEFKNIKIYLKKIKFP